MGKVPMSKPEKKFTGNRIKKGNHSMNPGKTEMIILNEWLSKTLLFKKTAKLGKVVTTCEQKQQ